jgi:hypothetical protein
VPNDRLLLSEKVILRQNGFQNPKSRNFCRFQNLSPFLRRQRYFFPLVNTVFKFCDLSFVTVFNSSSHSDCKIIRMSLVTVMRIRISSLKYLHKNWASLCVRNSQRSLQAVFTYVVITVSSCFLTLALSRCTKLVSLYTVTSNIKSVSEYGMKFSQRKPTL